MKHLVKIFDNILVIRMQNIPILNTKNELNQTPQKYEQEACSNFVRGNILKTDKQKKIEKSIIA